MSTEKNWCECEHEDHFPKARHTLPKLHAYGIKREDLVDLPTMFGRFRVCRECADGCLKEFKEEAPRTS